MKVILLKDVKDIGSADTVKDISDGYARNFLLPNSLAVKADKGSLRSLDIRLKVRSEQLEAEKAELMKLASKINGAEVEIRVDVGENGKLFGSVTHHDIAQKLSEKIGIDVDKRKIILDQPIKAIGSFDVPIKFAHDISAIVKVNVDAASK